MDLVKAFNAVNHELLYQILLKYGLPPGLVQKVKKLNSNCRVKIKARSKITELMISWQQVREKHIKNKEVRKLLCNIPKIDTFIMKRTAVYIGKVTRAEENSLPKKILAAWIRGSRKTGTPQLTCNNNFAETIHRILPSDKALSNKSAPLREWIPLASQRHKQLASLY
jgi:hypothetical protein